MASAWVALGRGPYPRPVAVLDRAPLLSPTVYRRITLVALWSLVLIVVTGAGVRLTESGLGCSTWPSCEPGSLTPRAEVGANGWIEALNRYLTGFVSLAVAASVLGSLRRSPRRRDLTLLSWGLVAGVVGQILLGGAVVLFHVHPMLVQGHFLLSAVLVGNAVVLHHRAGLPDDEDDPSTAAAVTPLVAEPLRGLAWLAVGAAAVVMGAGTVVTATGPHGGDEGAERLDFSITRVAQVHSILTWVFLAIVVVLAVRLRRDRAPRRAMERVTAALTVIVGQGAIGYLQYATGVPELLVGLHIFGSMIVWAVTLRLALALATPLPEDPTTAPVISSEGRGAMAGGAT